MPPTTKDTPAYNLSGDPYYTDGLRLVVMLSDGEVIQPKDREFLDWLESADPLANSLKPTTP